MAVALARALKGLYRASEQPFDAGERRANSTLRARGLVDTYRYKIDARRITYYVHAEFL